MELNLIDPIAESIVSAQHRRIFISLEAPTDRFFGAREMAKLHQERLSPSGALALKRCMEDCIRLKEIVVEQRRGLISDSHDTKSPAGRVFLTTGTD